MNITSTHHLPQENTLQEIVDWAKRRDPVRAVLLTSTRAIPGARVDELSDYDVILVVLDIRPFATDPAWLDDFGEVLVAYWDPIHVDGECPVEHCANVVQYRDGLKMDFTMWPVSWLEQVACAPELPAELEAGYRVLLDKDQLTAEMKPASGRAYIPERPSHQEYQRLINDFLSDAPYVAKCLWRDELLPAKWCLDYDMKHLYLRQVLEWLVELEHDWSQPVGALGKGLKRQLPAELWSDLEQTYAGASLNDNWIALESTLGLFREVAKTAGERLGYEYPEQLHAKVVAYVEHIRNS